MDTQRTQPDDARNAPGGGTLLHRDEFLLVRATPCDLAFHVSQVLQVGSTADFPDLSLVDLSTALETRREPVVLAPEVGRQAPPAQPLEERTRSLVGTTVLLVGTTGYRIGLIVQGRVSMIAAAKVQRLSLPPLLRTHESIVGVLVEAESPMAVVVDVPRLLVSWKGSP